MYIIRLIYIFQHLIRYLVGAMSLPLYATDKVPDLLRCVLLVLYPARRSEASLHQNNLKRARERTRKEGRAQNKTPRASSRHLVDNVAVGIIVVLFVPIIVLYWSTWGGRGA